MNELKKIKIVFIDIDGTLTNSEQEISQETIKALKKLISNKIIVVIISGRGNKYVCKFSKLLSDDFFSISSNGAEIYDYKNNQNIKDYYINQKTVDKLKEYAVENEVGYIFNTKTNSYANNTALSIKELKNDLLKKEKDSKENIYQVILISYDKRKFIDIKNTIKKEEDIKITNISNSLLLDLSNTYYYCDITNKDASKGEAVKYLLKYLKLNKDEALCFGDGFNDQIMFRECGFKVAMGNSIQQLKEISDYITLSNDDNGIAVFINEFMLD